MKIVLKRPLADVLLCLLWSIILLPLILLNMEGTIRIILGLPFLLFIPGYLLSFALFPLRKTNTVIDTIERIALSFALSLAIVPIIGLGLNFTPWGLQLVPILLSILVFIFGVGAIALYRWHRTPSKERLITTLNVSLPKPEKNLDTVLTIIIVASIIIAPASLTYVILSPRTEKPFTEFYILGPEGTAESYQRDLAIEENTNVIIGIANHEHKTINYTIEIWLLDQSIVYNVTTFEDKTVYNHMWYMHEMNVVLDHTQADIEKPWEPQWEYNFTFNITRKGNFKLLFLLFTTPTEEYTLDVDYKDIVEQKINDSYGATNLWLDVSNLPKIYDVSTTPSSTLQGGFVNISCKVFDADGVDEVSLRIRDPDNILHIISITNNNTGYLYYCNRTYTVAGEYNYLIWANDTTNNVSTSSGQFSVTDIPKILDVWVSPTLALKGHFVNISCMVYDTDGVNEVFLNITYPDSTVQNFSIIGNRTGLIYYCDRTYMVLGEYSYFIWVNDTRGNTNMSDVKHFSVTKQYPVDDLPSISNVLATPPSTSLGGFVNISCTIYDFDGVDEVYLNIRDPDNATQNFSITSNKTGDTYYCNRTYSVAGDYTYFIWANDTTGNASVSDVKQFSVIFA